MLRESLGKLLRKGRLAREDFPEEVMLCGVRVENEELITRQMFWWYEWGRRHFRKRKKACSKAGRSNSQRVRKEGERQAGREGGRDGGR